MENLAERNGVGQCRPDLLTLCLRLLAKDPACTVSAKKRIASADRNRFFKVPRLH